MKKVALISMAVLFSLTGIQRVQAQKALRNKQVYLEYFGPGVVSSASFDSRFKSGEALGFGYRAGLGFSIGIFVDDFFWHDKELIQLYLTFPLGLNYVFGKKGSPHACEIGAGATVLTRKVNLYNYEGSYKPGYFLGHLSFMYRRVPTDGGFTWRIGFNPMIGTAGDIIPSGAIGFGYAF
ncbi:hypothetical protein Barb6_02244 [Bacteroidales bacterium Barb6]|nr:hypothetical protein Barb6_02244 [Bacteroidales bacterium Barb6]